MTEAFETLRLHRFVSKAEEGLYLLIPFEMPAGLARIELDYTYRDYDQPESPVGDGVFTARRRVNIVDLGLIAPDGTQVGASGSNKRSISVSGSRATPGYHPHPLTPGTWQIMLGAYVVEDAGVDVDYELRFFRKQGRWLKGDLHTHTNASDGVLTLEHLARHAHASGLDFLAVTDHNQPIQRASLPQVDGLTIIPGVEWTHYKGHSNFWGHEAPYDGSFMTNTVEEMRQKFAQAHERGAVISINHPFEEPYSFQFDFEQLPYDCLEVWNGPMRPNNLRAIGYWDAQLKAGRRVIASCGSDYHADEFLMRLAGPCINVFAYSDTEADILDAVRAGRSYFTFQPDVLGVEMRVGDAMLGESAVFAPGLMLTLALEGLKAGDQVKLIGMDGERQVAQAPERGSFRCELPIGGKGYVRLEIWREFYPGIPMLPALITNPIWVV